MNTPQQIANKRAKQIAACVVGVMITCVIQVANGQEQSSKPFVLKPASPSALESTLPGASYPVEEEALTSHPQRAGHGALVPQPMPANRGTMGRAVPGSAMPGNPRGETFYVAPDGRVVKPTHVYRGGRIYPITPQRNARATKKKDGKPRPKIDYSLAPVQPAIKPRLLPKEAPKAVPTTRVVDGAPLIRQEAVVSADRPAPKKTNTKQVAPSRPAPIAQNAPWLNGVRRMMDGNRSNRQRKPNAQVASKPSSRDRR